MLTKQASDQILEYAAYIQNETINPQAARKFVKDLREAVAGLDTMPQRHRLLEEKRGGVNASARWSSVNIWFVFGRGTEGNCPCDCSYLWAKGTIGPTAENGFGMKPKTLFERVLEGIGGQERTIYSIYRAESNINIDIFIVIW